MIFSSAPWAEAGRIVDLLIFLNAARPDLLLDHFRSWYTMKSVAVLAQAHVAGSTFGTETEGCGNGSVSGVEAGGDGGSDFNETGGQCGARRTRLRRSPQAQ